MRVKRLLAAAIGGVLLGVGAGGPLQAAHAAPVLVDSTPDRAWGVNGRVYATTIVGNTVYVGGRFSAAVAPEGRTVPRANLAAFDVTTGELLPWTANATASNPSNAFVRAIEAVGSNLVVGGSFAAVNGIPRSHVAEVTQATGSTVTAFKANADSVVRAVESDATSVYLGGQFNRVNGAPALRAAKVSSFTGTLDTTFKPAVGSNAAGTATGSVFAIKLGSGGLYLGGSFVALSGQARNGLGQVDPVSGALSGPAFAGGYHDVLALDLDTAGTTVFVGNTANRAQAFSTTSGRRLWSINTDGTVPRSGGDVQAIRYSSQDGNVYFGHHDSFNSVAASKLQAVDALTGARDPHFAPTFDGFWGVFAIDVAPGRVVVGGGPFTTVTGVRAMNLALF